MEETWGLKDYSEGDAVRSRDPVCGAVVDEENAAAEAEFDGERYYFCSEDCKNKFTEDPEHYFGQRP
jgi:YHS domain-containing protein